MNLLYVFIGALKNFSKSLCLWYDTKTCCDSNHSCDAINDSIKFCLLFEYLFTYTYIQIYFQNLKFINARHDVLIDRACHQTTFHNVHTLHNSDFHYTSQINKVNNAILNLSSYLYFSNHMVIFI